MTCLAVLQAAPISASGQGDSWDELPEDTRNAYIRDFAQCYSYIDFTKLEELLEAIAQMSFTNALSIDVHSRAAEVRQYFGLYRPPGEN